jgi:predicted dienelactone hydrolase
MQYFIALLFSGIVFVTGGYVVNHLPKTALPAEPALVSADTPIEQNFSKVEPKIAEPTAESAEPKEVVERPTPTPQPVVKPVEKKKKKGGTKKKNDDYNYDSYNSSYTYTPFQLSLPSTAATHPVDSAAIAAEAEKKQVACKKDLKECISTGNRNAGIQFQGSAVMAATIAYQNQCRQKYPC